MVIINSLQYWLYIILSVVNYAVNQRFIGMVEDYQFQTNFLHELVLSRDKDLVFSKEAYFSLEELELIIYNIFYD